MSVKKSRLNIIIIPTQTQDDSQKNDKDVVTSNKPRNKKKNCATFANTERETNLEQILFRYTCIYNIYE